MSLSYITVETFKTMAMSSTKTRGAYLCWFLCMFGIFGAQRFYLGQRLAGFIYLFTLGGLFVGQIIDFFTLPNIIEEIAQRNNTDEINDEKNSSHKLPLEEGIQQIEEKVPTYTSNTFVGDEGGFAKVTSMSIDLENRALSISFEQAEDSMKSDKSVDQEVQVA